jgi:hypothetical protein
MEMEPMNKLVVQAAGVVVDREHNDQWPAVDQ